MGFYWNLPVLPVKNTVELACQILSEDGTAWLTIRQLYREMKSRGRHAPFASVNRALDREVAKPNRKIRKEELHGFSIQLYGLSSREWNEEDVLTALLSD